jgi:hypothetical protein
MSNYRPPSDLAHQVRESLLAKHRDCYDNGVCGVKTAHAEDIQEILDEAAAIQNREVSNYV